MKYDDASWHYEGDFPEDLDDDASATHIGIYLAWCVMNGLGGELHTEELAEELAGLRSRELTPGAWLLSACDGKLTDEDLNGEGNAFTAFYYAPDESPYFADYDRVLSDGLASIYHVADTWQAYELLAPVIAKRYSEWKQAGG